jgi:phage baseplate assembly protein V
MRQVDIGRISAVYPERATARVLFDDYGSDGIVSRELSIISKGSMGTKDYWIPEVNEMVLCVFLAGSQKQGFVVGTFFNDIDRVPVSAKQVRHLSFPDGASVEYDTRSKVMSITLPSGGTLDVKGTLSVDKLIVREGGGI